METKPLAGRVAVITGASRGFGREIALALADDGAAVVVTARSRGELEALASDVLRAGGTALAHPADIREESQVDGLKQVVAARFGRTDILVNNAGINIRKTVTEFTAAEWRSVIDTNLVAAFLMCRAFVPLMQGRQYGRILNLTSIMSHVAMAGRTAYAASKTGLLGLTKALALELAPEGITVNGISPGPFATEMNRPLLENAELNRQFLARVPLGRWGEPRDIGAVVRFLCSPAAHFITGTDLVIDGGWLAQ